MYSTWSSYWSPEGVLLTVCLNALVHSVTKSEKEVNKCNMIMNTYLIFSLFISNILCFKSMSYLYLYFNRCLIVENYEALYTCVQSNSIPHAQPDACGV